eukprot:2433106-Amphidinium_carterae.1
MEDIPKGNWLVMPPSSKEAKQEASWVAPTWLYTLLDQALLHTAFQPAVNPVKLQAALSRRNEDGVKRPQLWALSSAGRGAPDEMVLC